MPHDLNETVQCLLRLRFRRLYHDRLMEQKREVDRRGMESVIEKPLRNIQGSDASGLVLKSVKDELMLAD